MMRVFKQRTAYEVRISDWSPDVGSSDLVKGHRAGAEMHVKVQERGREVLLFRKQPCKRRGDGRSADAASHADDGGRHPAPVRVRVMRSGGENGRAACRERGDQYV